VITTNPNSSFEATASWGSVTGLVGTISVGVYDGVGGTTIAPHTTGIVEVATGVYTATMIAPSAAGQYTIVWNDGVQTASDELMVTTSVSVPVTPVPGPGMSVGDLLDGILLDRFEPEHRARALEGLNNRYAHLWAIEDWTWKYAQIPVIISVGVQNGSGLPADFGVPMYLWDDRGNELTYQEISAFRFHYPPATQQGPPECWTVVDQQIMFGPIPGSNATFQTYYRKRLIPLTDEGQVPDIPLEFQLALVHGGRAELLAFYNDPTAADMEQLWQMDLDALRKDYLADVTGQPSMWSSDLAALVG
jgi:hypothetical protein